MFQKIVCMNSILQNKWIKNDVSWELINSIRNNFNLSYLTASVIASRKINFDEIESFLNPSLKKHWQSPELLPDIQQGVDAIMLALQQNQTVGILGDYDVDGISATVIWHLFFEQYGNETHIWLPNRQQNYGPSKEALEFFNAKNIDLLIVVDCGTSAFDFMSKFHKTTIIVDHHFARNFVKNKILINPHRIDQNHLTQEPYKNLCAASLSMLIVCQTLKMLNADNQKKRRTLNQMLDLAAIATICDIMKLDDLNRAIVSEGLKILEKQEKPGLKVLIQKAQIKFPLSNQDIGFLIGPRLNAAGRMKNANIAFELLITKNYIRAIELVNQLDNLNFERKTLQEIVYQQVYQEVQTDKEIICLANKNWSAGIVGVVAAMIEKEFHKPSVIGTIMNNNGDLFVKASARSSTFNIGELIEQAIFQGIISSGGGHKFAGGFVATIEQFKNFEFWANEILINSPKIERYILIDVIIDLNQLNFDYKKLAPCGLGNEEIVIMTSNVKIKRIIELQTMAKINIEQNFKIYTFFLPKIDKIIKELQIASDNFITVSLAIRLDQKGFHKIIDLTIDC